MPPRLISHELGMSEMKGESLRSFFVATLDSFVFEKLFVMSSLYFR